MHLKRLEIHGFKSFANRTEIDFLPGITAVVGPNGSGKSNVSDALLWVLGEQNARNLRGEGSSDLIFAGTDKRRPVGMAEVSLCVDNTDRGLPMDFGEVTITRRVYRSGEGEFFINRTPCRLKDIYELFLDTGVGRDAYSIIGQNQIHAVLSARSEERRELLEEAAGIKKYRHRRKEAHRKLENTRQNLTRVVDILSELEGQVEPLEIQARAAERWQGLSARLKELEIGLLAVDLLRKTEELSNLREEKDGLEREAQSLAARLTREEAAEHQSRQQLARLEGEIETLRRSRDEARETALKLEGQLALARQQAVADVSERMRLVAEQTRLETRAEELKEEEDALKKERDELEARFAEWSLQSEAQSPAIRSMESRVRDLNVALDRLRRQASEGTAKRAALEEKASQLERQLSEGSDRADSDRIRLEKLAQELEESKKREEEALAAAEEARERLKSHQETLKALEAEISGAKLTHNAALTRLKERQNQAMRLGARLRSLEEMHRSLEGVYRGVRAVIQAARAGEIEGEYKVVADYLTVPPSYGMAMEVALGAHAQDIVTQRDREAQAAIQYLKRKNAGRATFLPLDLIRGDRMRAETGYGIHGLAVDLIEYPAEVRSVMEMLLGRVLIVEDMEIAVKLVRGGGRSGSRVGGRMVTLEGELINPNGSLTGGSREGGPGILSRKLEIDRLTQEVNAESERLKSEEDAVRAAEDAIAQLETQRETLRGEIAAGRVEVAQRESSLDHAGRESRRLSRECEDAERRLKQGQTRLEDARSQGERIEKERADADALIERCSREEAETRAALSEVTEAWELARTAFSSVQMELARAREQRNGMEDRRRRLERLIRELSQQQGSVAESLLMLDERRGRDTGQEDALEEQLEVRQTAAATLDRKLADKANDRTAFMESMGDRMTALKSLAAEKEAAQQRLHKLEVREAGLISDIEHLQLRLMVDYEAEPEHAPMLAGAVSSRQNTAVEVNRLKRDMMAVGTVNLGAIEEYRRVSERVEFLRTQKDDLEEAEAILLKVITEIDATTQEAFQATFDRVAQAFDEMFRRLFNGGRTQLVLTDPNNVLETGIDIIVQPPGKKLQHLQLLSGGEKALTAVALLFALLEVKPSPFCLLDEVDAALDEANVSRFADMVKDFSRKSQFIIITHNKNTMASADTLYGVTMEEPGVSKILSVRLED